MKRADINPFFKLYDSTTYDNNIDFTKSGNINAYSASGFNNLEKGQKLFDFDYMPILEGKVYKELLDYYDNSIVLVELYRIISFNYFNLYAACIKWYIENSKSFNAFNLDTQVRKYELKVLDDFCCPIVKYLDLDLLDNINVFRNIKSIMSYSEIKNINSINTLLYGDNQIIRINQPPTDHGKLLLNSIVNIVYNRFLQFLISENSEQNHGVEKSTNIRKSSEIITAGSLRLFCSIVHQCGIIQKAEDGENGEFCDKVLQEFNLLGIIKSNGLKLRQGFRTTMDIKASDINLIKVQKLIIPNIQDSALKNIIEQYINSKTKVFG